MALFTLAGIFVVVYFPFPIQQEEIALNIEYELGQTNNFVPLRSIFGYIKDFFPYNKNSYEPKRTKSHGPNISS